MIRAFYTIKYFFLSQKNWLKNCFKYKKALEETCEYDYAGTLLYMREHLKSISYAMKTGAFLQEEEETRLVKEYDMDRVVALITHMMEDDFADRCGYDNDFVVRLIPSEDEDYVQSESTITEAQRENNTEALEKAMKLEEEEWKEFIKTLKKMRGWWI